MDFCNINVACENCGLARLCLAGELSKHEARQLGQIMSCKLPIEKGQYLFKAGEAFNNIYAIRSGTVQSYLTAGDDLIQITGFHLAGELLGLDAISDEHYLYNCRAKERTSICEIPFEQFKQLAKKIPALQRQLLWIMSHEMAHTYKFNHFFGRKTAKSRLVTFLLNLSTRFQQRGFSAYKFHLSMSRCDIANYIGLNVETVSRLFSQLKQDNLLSVHGRYLHILDKEALAEIAHH